MGGPGPGTGDTDSDIGSVMAQSTFSYIQLRFIELLGTNRCVRPLEHTNEDRIPVLKKGRV